MRIGKPDTIVAVQAARSLEVAVDSATNHLMAQLIDEFDFYAAGGGGWHNDILPTNRVASVRG